MAMEENTRKNPWLGLESYREGEILYGRDEDIRDLTQCVLNDSDTLLYGKSGIGKSSVLNAGVIPAARRYGFEPILIRLSHKEQHSYLQQIKDVLSSIVIMKQVVDCKDVENESLYEFFHRHTFHTMDGQRTKLLIIFDQFEEMFTLQSDEAKKKHFFADLADLLNDIMPDDLQNDTIAQSSEPEEIQTLNAGNFDDLFSDLQLASVGHQLEYISDNEIHLVFTIREDFLSEFEYYTASIPSLKQNRYGLRSINEEQAAQIILRPIPGLISKQVAKLIVQKVTGRTDFDLNGIPEIEVDAAVLSLYLNRLYDAKEGEMITAELVEQKGGEIIADFYNDAISEISASTIDFLENMLLNGQGRRDNITVYDAIHDGGTTEEELNILCNRKKILRQFNYAGDLRIEYVHDILCPIVKAHKEERIQLKQLEEERLRQEKEKEELVRQQKEKLLRIKAESRRQQRKNRIRFVAVLTLLVVVGVSWASWFLLNKYPFKSSYASFTTKNGWPEGIGPELSDNDKRDMPVYYQLVRYGYNNKNTRVNILNRHKNAGQNLFYGSPLVNMLETEGTDEKAKNFAVLLRKTSYWLYTPDNEGHISRMTAYDKEDNQLYAVQYYRSSNSLANHENSGSLVKQLWANYVDKDGNSMRVRDNGADRIRLITDKEGYQIGEQFFSEMGIPQSNYAGVYGYRYKVNENGCIAEKVSLDAFGDSVGVATYTDFDQYGRWIKTVGGMAVYEKDRIVVTMDRTIDSLLLDDNGYIVRYSTNKADGSYINCQYENNTVVSYSIFKQQDNILSLKYQKKILPQIKKNVLATLEFYADSVKPYRLKYEEYKKGASVVSYFCGDSPSMINEPYMMNDINGLFHQQKTDTVQDGADFVVIRTFHDSKGRLSTYCETDSLIEYYNANHEMLKQIGFKNNSVCISYQYDYDNGLLVAQSVIDEDGKIIRYPQWDNFRLCYYKMKFVRDISNDFLNSFIAVKGINEFGEESLISYGEQEYCMMTLPSVEMKLEEDNAFITVLQKNKEQLRAINRNNRVDYIRILDKTGTWYQAGVRSGDLLINEGKQLTVARPNIDKNTYDILSLPLSQGNSGAEHYSVFFTEKEMKRYNNSIKNIK